MCKIKTLDGAPLRDNKSGRTFFVLEAAKEMAKSGAFGRFTYKTEDFDITENSANKLAFIRSSTGENFEFAKVNKDAKEAPTPAPAPAPETEYVQDVQPEATPDIHEIADLLNKELYAEEMKAEQDAKDAEKALEEAIRKVEEAKANAARAKEARENAEKEKREKEERERREREEKARKEKEEQEKKSGNLQHDKFKEVLFAVKGNMHVYLFGPAGTGKTTLAKQVADELGRPFYSVSSLLFKSDCTGFVDANGVYHSSELYKAVKNGGVFLFDEIDASAPEALVPFNMILEQGFFTFSNGEIVEANKNFVAIAAGNTKGRGADEAYNTRQQLDASTLDRFAFVDIYYNKDIDLRSCENDSEIYAFCLEIRKVLENQMLAYTFSPRALSRLAKAAKATDIFTTEKALSFAVCGGWDKNDCAQIANALPESKNKYIKAFKSMFII